MTAEQPTTRPEAYGRLEKMTDRIGLMFGGDDDTLWSSRWRFGGLVKAVETEPVAVSFVVGDGNDLHGSP
ncbi:hypothetical protein QYF36_019016 [Acer negundo]|nr:hypothetical protein QYF36_019016 [Acer negundo]